MRFPEITEIVPATHKKAPRAVRPGQPAQGAGRPDGAYRAPRGGDEGYRRRDDGEGKKEQAAGDFRPRVSSSQSSLSIFVHAVCAFSSAVLVEETRRLLPEKMYLEMSASASFIADFS